ncbi:lactate permease [Saccharopolyspora kobensis]|uniref:L-lactate permease n=1 Tax=Saccharopolyspora kobensis TaxID=146035 RepID=A0A1H6DAT5_9PSEU|nr:L-lactate permease [Saccharopolyspora kobensis]SEG82348.1 lactate permease [Saccharopolyspora kobensis]SFE24239.1 lactate permease [Saccharopolyspora kobensis]
MVWTAAVSPLLLVLVMITGLRRPAHWAALAGTVLAVALIWWLPDFALPADLTADAGGAGLLVLNAAAVMLPGVYLSQVLTRREVHRSLQEWVRALPLPGPAKIALVVAGIAPTVEALTGFGVSLLVTVPVLLALAPPATALRQAMLGMNIMPWGTLGLATVIGAALAGVGTAALGTATAITSSLVFPLVAVWATLLVRPRRRFLSAAVAAGVGGMLSLGLLALNWMGMVEAAGVVAGLLTTAIALVLGRAGAGRLLPPRAVLVAYGLVLGGIAASRAAIALGVPPLELRAGETSFALLSSPGLPLLAAALLLDRGRLHGPDVRAALARVGRPLLALAGFVVLGRLMAGSGMIGELGAAVGAAPPLVAVLAAPALGMLSGFITGSNVGGNALMMPLQERLAASGVGEWFAAVQNSAAGHAVFTSLPMIMLVLAVAGDRAKTEEHTLLRFGLGVAAAVYAALALVAVVVS